MNPVSINADKSDFFERVFEVVKLIPEGRVTSYGAIAAYLGSKQSSRMVGWAMNASHRIPGIPAHRVVNRNGLLTGKAHFLPDPEEMERRLLREGIVVKEDRIENFNAVYWDPVVGLSL